MATEIEELLQMEFYGPSRDRGYRAQCAVCPWKTMWLVDEGRRMVLAREHSLVHRPLTAETASHTLSG